MYHLHCLPVYLHLEAILVRRLIQAEGNAPKRATAPTGGPSSATAELPLPEKGRQAVGEAGGSAGEQAEGKEKRGDGDWALHNPTGPLGVSRQACVLCGRQQGHTVMHVARPSRHKQMFFWVLLFHFSCNCFPSGPASGTRCQAVGRSYGDMERQSVLLISGFGVCSAQTVSLSPCAPRGFR